VTLRVGVVCVDVGDTCVAIYPIIYVYRSKTPAFGSVGTIATLYVKCKGLGGFLGF